MNFFFFFIKKNSITIRHTYVYSTNRFDYISHDERIEQISNNTCVVFKTYKTYVGIENTYFDERRRLHRGVFENMFFDRRLYIGTYIYKRRTKILYQHDIYFSKRRKTKLYYNIRDLPIIIVILRGFQRTSI